MTSILTDDERIVMCQNYVAKGGDDVDMVTSLLGEIIETGSWSNFTDQLGNPVSHGTFREFVETPRWKGLGTTKTALVAWTREQDADVAEAIETVWRGEVPAMPRRGEVGRGRDRCGATTSNDVDRNEADGILARLKRDHPDLAARVVAGDLTANAAALIVGWRKPRVLLTSPESVAAAIRKHWPDDMVHDLVRRLGGTA